MPEVLYTKDQVRRIVKRFNKERKNDNRIRRKSKAIHFLINIKSHNINPYKEDGPIRYRLAAANDGRKTGKMNFNRALRSVLARECGRFAFAPGNFETFSNQYNGALVDDLPF